MWREIHRLQPNIQWNCFLVDDYANKPLRLLPNQNIDIKVLKKGQLIKEISNQPPNDKSGGRFLAIANLIEKEKEEKEDKWTVQDLIDDLTAEEGKEKVYDIIFLDYYLGELFEDDKPNSYDYGYRLLEEIVKSKRGKWPTGKKSQSPWQILDFSHLCFSFCV